MIFIDGHLLLAAILCPPLAWLLIALANARLARRVAERQAIFTKAGAR